MRITLEVDDAVRMLDYLNREGKRLCAKEISKGTGVSVRFALKILRKLCAAQIVRSYKGSEGGYELNHAPKEISLLDIVEAVNGKISLTKCVATEVCTKYGNDTALCKFHHLYSDLSESIRQKLDGISLDQISDTGQTIVSQPEESECK